METNSTTEKGSQVRCEDGLGVNRRGNAILCYAWGETDRPDACLAKTAAEVRAFLIREAFGDEKDAMLDEWMQELAKWDWQEDGELKWEFEIGGVRLEDVTADETMANRAFNMAAGIAKLHDALQLRFWWLIERMRDVPSVRVYPCQAESGHGYFTAETRGERFSGGTVEEAIDAAMTHNHQSTTPVADPKP